MLCAGLLRTGNLEFKTWLNTVLDIGLYLTLLQLRGWAGQSPEVSSYLNRSVSLWILFSSLKWAGSCFGQKQAMEGYVKLSEDSV